MGSASRRELLLVGLLCLLPPLAAQLRLPPPRIDSDAVEYYSHLRSLYRDGDLDLANEFDHFGVLTRADKAQPTRTGMRRSIYAIGPSLLWMPFYAAGDVATKAAVGGGLAVAFVVAVLACHGLAFVALQLGFQRGGVLATAGLATLLTNALPIAAGTTLFGEGLGSLPVVRVLAFACTVLGAALLARAAPSERETGVTLSPAPRPIPFD